VAHVSFVLVSVAHLLIRKMGREVSGKIFGIRQKLGGTGGHLAHVSYKWRRPVVSLQTFIGIRVAFAAANALTAFERETAVARPPFLVGVLGESDKASVWVRQPSEKKGGTRLNTNVRSSVECG
jgi:hypothetical protein